MLIRTDFSNPEAWAGLRQAIHDPTGLFVTSLTFVDDPAYTGLTRADLLSLDEHERPTFVFIADAETMQHPDHPVLVLDIFGPSGIEFRGDSVPDSVHRNQSLAGQHGRRGVRQFGRPGRHLSGVLRKSVGFDPLRASIEV